MDYVGVQSAVWGMLCSNIGRGQHVASSRAARKLFEQILAIKSFISAFWAFLAVYSTKPQVS
jgi:hypothetical protein